MPDWVISVLLATATVLYFMCVLGLVLHAFGYAYLYWLRRLRYAQPPLPAAKYPPDALPVQIVQLPVYNEDPEMVKALVISACRLDYPRERLMVQLLDDSDDPAIASHLSQWVDAFSADHPDIDLYYLRRPDRHGFKAGNLNAGLAHARPVLAHKGVTDTNQTMVSIFDADFRIPADYLNQTVHYFSSSDIGAVQTELEYINRDENLLTLAQAVFMENLHRNDFATRSHSGHLTSYRGSAGSWRLAAIDASGGWQGDTQIEDVDMSMAAQLKGWRIVFLDHVRVACQLPQDLTAFKLQQRSWMKGIMEVFRKWAGSIWSAKHLTTWQKVMALDLFLILSLQPLYIILGHLLIIPTYIFLKSFGYTQWLADLTLGLLILFCFTHFSMLMGTREAVSRPKRTETAWRRFQKQVLALCLFPSMFPVFTYGLAEGLLDVEVHRDRTLKSTDSKFRLDQKIGPEQNRLLLHIWMFELVMSIYSIIFTSWTIFEGEWLAGGILSCFVVFYSFSSIATIRSGLSNVRFRPGGGENKQ